VYRCEATSVEAFVQQLACNLVNHGYWFYTTGRIPEGKNAWAIDRKLIEGYGLELSKWQRARRKANGEAKVSYLRFRRFFVIAATEGRHAFFRRERPKDIRRQPLIFSGYSIGCSLGSDGRYHASVKIDSDTFNSLRSYLLGIAVYRNPQALREAFNEWKFEPYARVRRQMLRLLREVNEARRPSGFEEIPRSVLALRRFPKRVFADEPSSGSGDQKV
jgi:hypothetical protein